MNAAAHDFGSLNPVLQATAEGKNVLRSAGPISDAYMLSTADVSLMTGPGGSGKTTASVKKALIEAQRIYPGSDGVRRYVLGVWRQKYDNLWSATIPSWWKILPENMPGARWVGARPRSAVQTIQFDDAWGRCEMITLFRAFGDSMDPEDVLGNEMTDAYLNEMSTLVETLFIALVDRVGRNPPREVIKRGGRIFGDSNAPDVTNWTYRDFYEQLKPGYQLFKQPGGLDPGAENLDVMGRGYYEQSARINAHRPWWVKRMVHARPGFTRDVKVIYEKFDDETMVSKQTLDPVRGLPVLVGIDGGFTPAAAYMQEMADGQLRILAEVVIERGGMADLGRSMLALEAARFRNCEFADTCDPSMTAGEDIEGETSDRQKLAKVLGRKVEPASTNETSTRIAWISDKLELSLGPARPGLLLDPSCKALRRGFNQTYHYKQTQGTNDISSVAKTPDSHVMEGAQYAASKCGTAAARRRHTDLKREREERRKEAREQGRYNPFQRRRA